MERKAFLLGLGAALPALALGRDVPTSAPEALADVKNFGAKGDGVSDDTASFRRCLETHGHAWVPQGIFVLNNLELDGVLLHGVGTLKASTSPDCLVLKGAGARVEGLRFATTNSKAKAEIRLADGCTEALVSRCRFDGKAYSALAADANGANDSSLVYKSPVARLRVEGNHFRGYVCQLYLHSVTDAQISGNFFTESFYDAIRLRQGVERVVIEGNHFVDVGISKEEVSRDAVDAFWSGRELIISSNILRGIAHVGLDLKGAEPTGKYVLRHVLVAHNHIEEAGYCGIVVSSGALPQKGAALHVGPVNIQGNMVINCNQRANDPADAGIYLRHGVQGALVAGNHVRGHQGHGIAVTNFLTGTPRAARVQLMHNQVTDCHHPKGAAGIAFHQVDHFQVQGNMVEGCDFPWFVERVPSVVEFREKAQFSHNYWPGAGREKPVSGWAKLLSSDKG